MPVTHECDYCGVTEEDVQYSVRIQPLAIEFRKVVQRETRESLSDGLKDRAWIVVGGYRGTVYIPGLACCTLDDCRRTLLKQLEE